MIPDIAIRAENLSKLYHVGTHQRRHDTLRDALSDMFRRSDAKRSSDESALWALKDVSFEVKRGEVIGIIGRNGAGKSTLLKILSRITEPTKGRAEIHGRVGSLLEVGTGFHPELTGRENIYLNGAILGMRRFEIDRKFDEIVAFAEIERFLDTPVKRYSSGMYVRLAFAVAAHLEPEMLLVDEVLAVGDAEFQKKCLGKMGDVAREGRTVLFVSHQMNAVRTMCHECVLLEAGTLVEYDDTDNVINKYLRTGVSGSEWVATSNRPPLANPYFNPSRLAVVGKDLRPLSHEIRADEMFAVLIEGDSVSSDLSLTVGFAVYASTGELLFWSLHTDTRQEEWPSITKGHNCLICWIPPHLLNEGEYRIELILSLHFAAWLSQPGVDAPSVWVAVRGGLSESPYWMMRRPGLLGPLFRFHKLEQQTQ